MFFPASPPLTGLPTAAKRSIKWIKGALIGAGSFGQVYLGMDAHTGLLMAVKQVDLSTGVQNEEKKLSMMTALQREIELLRELQHENIVQYLGMLRDARQEIGWLLTGYLDALSTM